MKTVRNLLFGTALLLAAGAAAQNPASYFMEGSILRSQLNPAFAPKRGYVNIPGLGGVDVNVSGNLSVDRILFPRDGRLVTLLDQSVSASDALSGLEAVNTAGSDVRVNLIGFGAYTRNGKHFWAFDLTARANVDGTAPYELFDFLKRGTSTAIRDIGATADSYIEAGLSYSFPLLNDRLYIGVRGKFLLGMARGRLHYDRFDATMDEDRWKIDALGSFDITSARLDINTKIDGKGEAYYKPEDITLRPTQPVGYGFAVDLGAAYDILPDLQASLAVNDLGFIAWGKGHNRTAVSAKELEFTGMEVDANGTKAQPRFDLDVLKFQPADSRSVTRMLRASVNAGIEYKLWRRKIGLGLLYTARIWEYDTLHDLTASVNFQPIGWFTLTGSYSMIDNRGHAVGLALNLCPGWINFFIASDVILAKHTKQFVPVKQNRMNLTLGLGVPIGPRSRRCERAWTAAE